ncbi:hypothetical protein PR202_gb22825 [Eleusine coracana subsp. coracana]|uniref:Retrotransposon Copia-like N-terminal domain-containing protein n=1 Tax=Eleusine coracana subsp. coracana TaxID=191504 RepID=A0AAV5FGP2_ELECO|nr:hypothetical protein PR202_gb22825 [Eleusine coracana subsp. coracana]
MSATSSASNSASSSAGHTGLLPTPAFSQLISIKFMQDNYLLWTAQVVPYLKSQGLMGYVDGAISAPSQTIIVEPSEESGSPRIAVNPEYTRWYHQDQLILSALLSSLTEDTMGHVIGAKMARESVAGYRSATSDGSDSEGEVQHDVVQHAVDSEPLHNIVPDASVPAPIHAMRTRLKDNIIHPKEFTNGLSTCPQTNRPARYICNAQSTSTRLTDGPRISVGMLGEKPVDGDWISEKLTGTATGPGKLSTFPVASRDFVLHLVTPATFDPPEPIAT